MRFLLLSAVLAMSSSQLSAQRAPTSRSDSVRASQDVSRRQIAAIGFTPSAVLHPSKLEHLAFVSDSANATTWRRFRIGAAVGFAIGATVGIVVQSRANERATDGVELSPLFTAVVFGIPSAVLGGAIAARWPR